MLNELHEMIRSGEILNLIRNHETPWQTLDVLYEEPRVERVWLQLREDRRLYCHRIHPCEKPFFHPHPWPSAVYVLSESYRMNIGFGKPDKPPPVAAMTIDVVAGSGYEMLEPYSWHDVMPYDDRPSLSVMLTGKPWSKSKLPAKQKAANQPLTDAVKLEILAAIEDRLMQVE